jgi:hypothetical protein
MIEKSRFIGRIREVASKDEADCFFAEIRKAHRAATHNVPAFVIGDAMQLQWASDDGEPQGTSGAPIVHMLTSEGVTNAAVMVTRYFGGVKLGTGGLVRAYTMTAKAALDAAGVAVSTGSACQAGIPEPSHVVLAMGREAGEASSCLRITLGRTTTDADVDAFLAALPEAYARAARAGFTTR